MSPLSGEWGNYIGDGTLLKGNLHLFLLMCLFCNYSVSYTKSTRVTKMMPLACRSKQAQLKQNKLFGVILLVGTNPEGQLCSHYYSAVLFRFTISLLVSFLGWEALKCFTFSAVCESFALIQTEHPMVVKTTQTYWQLRFYCSLFPCFCSRMSLTGMYLPHIFCKWQLNPSHAASPFWCEKAFRNSAFEL